MTDEHQSYGSEDDKDVTEFTKIELRGLLYAAGAGIGIALLMFLWVYLKLEGVI